ncbi:MAG: hypothetical protein H8E31_14360 [Planctomycetes bacterium]|nr:hypothetical protein [Planctomycetota bacterium]
MIKFAAFLGLLVLGASAPVASSVVQDLGAAAAKPTVVLGSFDSRAVVLSYMRSARFEAEIALVREEMGKAQSEGDEEHIKAIGQRMEARQEVAHRQVFCAAPAPEVLAMLEDQLAGIAAEAGVDVIVSKWSLDYTRPGARLVDLTDRLVQAFDPDEETLESVRQIVVTDPLPLDQLSHEH